MLKKFLLFSFASVFIIFLSTSSMPNPQNPPTANSGAPGETACMLSGCHSGGNFIGTVDISGVPDTVFANQTYTITLTNTSNAVRSGFELTLLDDANKFNGTFTAGTNVNIAKDNSNGRTYARHASALFLTNGQASWTFKWKAPASATNENFTFYFTSMCANGDGGNSKDNSIKNTKRVLFQLPVANHDLAIDDFSSISFMDGILTIHDEQNRKTEHVIMIDLNGNLVFQSSSFPSNSLAIPNSIHGIYLVQYYLGQKLDSRKVFIP